MADSSSRKVSVDTIGKHNTASDCWIVINGDVWDVSEFAPTHPGGAEIILEYAGQDASKAYNEVHGPSLAAKSLDKAKFKGKLDEATVTDEWRAKQTANVEHTSHEEQRPSLDQIINLYDFEDAASKTISPKSWAYITGAANDCLTLAANADWYRKIWFRPRVMVGVKDVDVSTTVLGEKFDIPIFTSPCGLAKLGGSEGELTMARAAVARGTTLVVCNNASYSYSEIAKQVPQGYPLFYQLYVNKDRPVSEKLMREIAALKPKAIMVTVDLPVVGKREADERVQIEANYQTEKHAQVQTIKRDKKGAGLARATGSFIDPNLKWEDIKWLRSLTDIPIFLKGIQCAADARKALEYGVAGIYVSNHGGRAVDTAPPAILTLLEIQANCPEVLEQMEVFIDGGIRRGTDVLKAICLGASAVCIGRPMFYALGFGQEGVEKCFDILKDELETAMQMIGITKLSQAHPGLLNTGKLDRYVYRGDAHPYARKIVRRSKL